MGVYSEYLDRQMSFEELTRERKKQLRRISELRGRGVLVYASNINSNTPNGIDNSDIVPFSDQLSNIKSEDIDVIIETPGGVAEVVEDFVKLIRKHHKHLGIIVPGTAKSAGTIFTMAADEILMGEMSAVGPIDAQIFSNGKRFSADAFLQGLNKIRTESAENKILELAYIPMLQQLSPGEIQHCENAQKFSQTLVKDWLIKYKFSSWLTHNDSGQPVTNEEKEAKADDIAKKLGDHSHWLTHGRSIKIDDLRTMGLKITDYSADVELNDAIVRYFTLLQMTFETNIYKIYETPDSQVFRSINAGPPIENNPMHSIPNPLIIDAECAKCHYKSKIQLNFEKNFPLKPGAIPYPKDNKLKCPDCGTETDLLGLRHQLEAQLHKNLIIDGGEEASK